MDESNVEVTVNTDLNNDWAYLSLALINDDSGVAYDFGKEISYYYGRDSDGSWTEGGRSGSVSVPGIPGGDYYLRVEPEMEKDGRMHTLTYDVIVERGKPSLFLVSVRIRGVTDTADLTPRYASFSFENRALGRERLWRSGAIQFGEMTTECFGIRSLRFTVCSLIGAASIASYRGLGFTSVSTVRGVPKSIRDNPGAYRSIYSGYHRYSGGK